MAYFAKIWVDNMLDIKNSKENSKKDCRLVAIRMVKLIGAAELQLVAWAMQVAHNRSRVYKME
tara:strand:+ start:431 stop:619 length:189 start_codon:yes stop_codon:yes gene_type:complete